MWRNNMAKPKPRSKHQYFNLHNKLLLTLQHMFFYLDQGQTTPPRESCRSEQGKLCMS